MAGLYDLDPDAQVIDDYALAWDDPDNAAGTSGVPISDSESATGTDAGESIATAVLDAETGAAVDAGESVVVAITDSDSGVGADAGETLSQFFSDTEVGAAAESNGSIAAGVTDPETGAVVEAEALAVTLTDPEVGVGVDTDLTLVASLTDADVGAGVDAGSVAPSTGVDPPGLSTSGVATLTWSASPTAGVSTYAVFRRSGPTGVPFVPGTDTPILTGLSGLTFTDSGLAPGSYEYQVFGEILPFPFNEPGIEAIYDANDLSSITQFGGLVSQWNDLTGHGHHLVQATGSAQPSTGVATINGQNALRFTFGVSNLVCSSFTLAQPVTWLIVANVTGSGSFACIIESGLSGSRPLFYTTGGSNPPITMDAGTAVNTGRTALGLSRREAIFNGASSKYFDGGTQYGGTMSVGTGAMSALYLGGDNAGGLNSLGMDVAFIAVLQSSTVDMTAWAALASSRWAV